MRLKAWALAVVGAVVAALLGMVPSAQAAPSDTVTTTLREAVAALPVADEDRTGYNRERSFGTWIDADHNGCNTRAEVLLDEALQAPEVTGRCRLTPGTGRWYSWYDDQYVTSAGDLDVDHVVPLAEAWDSGASGWPQERRVAYANDLSDPRHLEAVSKRSNRQKADKDPAQWMPDEAVYCRYTGYWVIAKLRYELSADTVEKLKLGELASSCPNVPLTYTLAA
ncbi:DUF1524 domain-containing protein [Streptomyces sp. NPDC059590]|uniref:GmrSD restriction endonuclease domain-containing protein n=1 Tax=Streptomyces sp. NPDC059590 TaxID=3346877 RepID=UPI0036B6810E